MQMPSSNDIMAVLSLSIRGALTWVFFDFPIDVTHMPDVSKGNALIIRDRSQLPSVSPLVTSYLHDSIDWASREQ